MRPKPPSEPRAEDLFRSRLAAILDERHELVRLAKLIDWDRFDDAFGSLYVEHKGRPGLPTRLMAGLHLLQHAKGLSDDARSAPPGWKIPITRLFAVRSIFSIACLWTAPR
jgi:transposase, IS5 family